MGEPCRCPHLSPGISHFYERTCPANELLSESKCAALPASFVSPPSPSRPKRRIRRLKANLKVAKSDAAFLLYKVYEARPKENLSYVKLRGSMTL